MSIIPMLMSCPAVFVMITSHHWVCLFQSTPKRRSNSDVNSGGSSAKRIKTEPLRLKDPLLDASPSSHNAKARVSALLNRPVHIERPVSADF